MPVSRCLHKLWLQMTSPAVYVAFVTKWVEEKTCCPSCLMSCIKITRPSCFAFTISSLGSRKPPGSVSCDKIAAWPLSFPSLLFYSPKLLFILKDACVNPSNLSSDRLIYSLRLSRVLLHHLHLVYQLCFTTPNPPRPLKQIVSCLLTLCKAAPPLMNSVILHLCIIGFLWPTVKHLVLVTLTLAY